MHTLRGRLMRQLMTCGRGRARRGAGSAGWTACRSIHASAGAGGDPAGWSPDYGHRQRRGGFLAAYLSSVGTGAYIDGLVEGIQAGQRLAVSRALTLCESTHPLHSIQAARLLRRLVDSSGAAPGIALAAADRGRQAGAPHAPPGAGSHAPDMAGPAGASTRAGAAVPAAPTPAAAGGSLRIGVSGPPGVGKSSLLDVWGTFLADHGHRVAVLAVDPSSGESGGAILGDKTRMARLSRHPNAYVRPSPARGTLGGIARGTYDALLVCEAAGYDRVFVETVGVGQSETAVADMVDCMVLVQPPLGGDELQMIKRGIMEVGDLVAVNRADGATETAAMQAVADYSAALQLMPRRFRAWQPAVEPVSARTGRGVAELTRALSDFHAATEASGELQAARMSARQRVAWLTLEELVLDQLRSSCFAGEILQRLMPAVRAGSVAPRSAADYAMSAFLDHGGA